MAKLPAFQFYPGDWLQDKVAGCSLAAQGLWLRMLFIAHNSDLRGYLGSKLVPMTPEAIARQCGASLGEYTELLSELEIHGVPSRTPAGTLFSRRMIRDEKSRQSNKFRQQDFRNKNVKVLPDVVTAKAEISHIYNKTNINSNGDVTPMSQQSSSSSSSSKQKTKNKPQAAFVLPDWVPPDSWEAWLEMRRKKRAAPTLKAMHLAVERLVTLQASGSSPKAVLDQSTFRNWTGLFEVAQSPIGTGYANSGGNHGTSWINRAQARTDANKAAAQAALDRIRMADGDVDGAS